MPFGELRLLSGYRRDEQEGNERRESRVEEQGSPLEANGDLNFVHSGDLAAVKGKGSKTVNFLSTVHIYERDF